MFNTSDTNYSELDPQADMGNVANKAIDDVVQKNNAQYRQNAQTAVALADQRSQNFQKLGQLVKQAGSFANDVREFNANRDKLAAIEKEAEEANQAIQNQNTKLYNESVEKSKSIFNAASNTSGSISFADAAKADVKIGESEFAKNLQLESNKIYAEGVEMAFETDRNFASTDNIDNAEFGIKMFQTLSVPDFQTRGAALTSNVAKNYEGYIAANQDFKVPTEYGMLSIQDAVTSGDPNRFDAVMKFHRGAFYHTSGVFGGKNALSKFQQLKLLELTNATEKTQRNQFITDTYNKEKTKYELARQTDLADAILGGDPKTAIFGTAEDPFSGYIAKYEKISGKKDVQGALQLLESDIGKLVDKRILKGADLAKIVNIKGIKARDGSGEKTLKEFNPALHARMEGLLGTVVERETREKQAKDINNITSRVESATERLNGVEGGATEDHLKAEVKQVKQELRDLGIDVSDESIYNKYFTPLLNYHTKDDAYDEATSELATFAVDQGNFKSAQELINTIRDPKAKKKVQEYYNDREPIKNNKVKYDKIKNKLDDYIKKTKGITSTTLVGSIETNTILNNAGDHFNEIFLAEVKKKVPVSLALETAFAKVKEKLDMPSESNLRGKNNPGFGLYYVKGAGRFYNAEAQGGLEFNTAVAAYNAGKTLANPDTKNDWLNAEKPHEFEPVNELLQYTSGGPIPSYYIEASKHLRFTTAQDLMYARLKSLGYEKESGLIRDGSALHEFTKTAEMNKLLSYFPSSTKTGRAMFEFDGTDLSIFFDNFVRKTKDDQFGNKSHKNKELLDFENIPINDTLNAHIKDGYGYNGFGPFKLEASMIKRLEKASGLDFSKDTLSLENQKRLIFTKNMVDAGIDNFFSTGFYSELSLNELDMEGIFDKELDVHNLPYTLSPELIDSYFTEIF
jgi:hypothetical protein